MTRSHRKFHKVFWLIATPLMLVFFFTNQPEKENKLMPIIEIPAGSEVGIFKSGNNNSSLQ